MMNQFESSKKLEHIKNDDFRNIQTYFNDRNIENVRIKYKIRMKMLENIPGHFKNKYKNIKNGLKCTYCE